MMRSIVNFQPSPKTLLFFIVFSLIFIKNSYVEVQAQTGRMVEDVYPGLSSGALKAATLDKLPKGILLSAGDLIIKESEITKLISQSEPTIRKQLTQYAFFLLENITTKRMLLQEASREGLKKDNEDQAIMNLLSEKIKIAAVSEEELIDFHNQNKAMLENASLKEIREMLRDYLTQQKREEAIQQYIQTLGKRTSIRVNEEWAKKHCSPALNNQVDRARRSGKPTMVEFGAPGCAPCDMMTPILAGLKKKFSGKLNVLFVHVGQEQILGARFGIQVIPVQVFFNQNGLEVFRHTGFFPQAEVEKKLSQIGML
jgi:thiol-disulfide isomerase/thioredoxin